MKNNSQIKWELYLSRPFDLFGLSLWTAWYTDKACKELFGYASQNYLYVEQAPGLMRNYRDAEEVKIWKSALRALVRDNPTGARQILEAGQDSNERAKRLLEGSEKIETFEELIDFHVKNALCATVFAYNAPVVLKELGIEVSELSDLGKKLRAESYYPRVISELIVPLVSARLHAEGLQGEAVSIITLNELRKNDFSQIQNRVVESRDKRLMYKVSGHEEVVEWMSPEETTSLIARLEGVKIDSEAVIKGQAAYKGRVTGVVRVVIDYNFENRIFNEGDVLVTVNSNPNFMPLLQKCGAIITDEGGITCHAAIVSRELKKPCIIGTKIATQVLKDGDMVEVDAERGIVKILSRGLEYSRGADHGIVRKI
ncbi:MAG TPA: PEP-utilizing enzyme [Candidatus Paceibacterota bacterium]